MEREVEERMREKFKKEVEEVSTIMSKVGREDWVRAVNESWNEP